MFRFLVLIHFIFVHIAVSANLQDISKTKAFQVAEIFAGNNFKTKPVFRYESIRIDDEIKFHLFNGDHCFMIISASSKIYPVLAWSEESNFYTDAVPPAVAGWFENYASLLDFYTQHGIKPAPSVKQAWTYYSHSNPSGKTGNNVVPPFLLTTWNQGCFYNTLLPEDTLAPCGHLFTGCVATAMAQVMKYYNFPKNGTGSYGYNSNYGWLEANFENATYDWINMVANLTGENPGVAELMAHAAISVESQFFSNGTGAFDFDARDALVDYFSYQENMQFIWRDNYPGDWISLLKTELDEGRPVIYGGVDQSSQAGHTFIFDGYQDDFFHVNWGWGGQYNGYYYLDTLTPAGYHYNIQHDAIVGIKPDLPDPGVLFGPENLTATVNANTVSISWDPPSGTSNLELLGFNVFRNDSLLNPSICVSNEFLDVSVPAGNHEYKVATVFIGNGTGMVEIVEAYISGFAEQEDINIQIYPNPVQNELYIIWDPLDPIKGVRLFESQGRGHSLSAPSFSSGDRFIINMSPMQSGIYYLILKTGSQTILRKIIKV